MFRNKLLILLIILLAGNQGLFASKRAFRPLTKEQRFELMNSSTRIIENLSGKWKLQIDETEWKNVVIPYYIPENKEVVIKRTLKIDKTLLWINFWHIYFLGIDDEVEVYLNEQFIGRYFGSTAPFMVKIPPKLIRTETNTLMLKIYPAGSVSRQIKEQNLFTKKIYTGAIREILLVGTPHIWVSDINYKLKFNSDYSKCDVKTSVKISSGIIERMEKNYREDSLIYDKNKIAVEVEPIIRNKATGEIIAQAIPKTVELLNERTLNSNFSFTVLNPKLWTVTNPELYELTIRVFRQGVLIDDLTTDLGFRDISVGKYNGKPVLALNGNLFLVKGVDYVEDYYTTRQSLSVWRMEKDINLIKTLGANLVRIKYGIPNPYFLKLCNKHGLFVMIELPVYDAPDKLIGSDEIKVRMKNISEKIINAFSNDPSVFAWGLCEGVEEHSPEVHNFENYIMPIIRRYSNNPIYKAPMLSSDEIDAKNYDFIIFRHIGNVDKIDKIKNNLVLQKNQLNNKPMIFNFGAAIQSDNHNGYSDPYSIEAQAFYIYNLFYLAKKQQLAGSILWSFNDYLLNNPYMSLNNDNKFICTSGLTDRYRQQRLSYSTLQSLLNNEKDPLFYAGSYSEDASITFIIYGLLTAIAIILLLNRFKRFREYLFRSILRPYNFYADIRDQRIMSTVQTYILGLIISITIGIFLSSITYYYKSSELAQYIYMFLMPFSGLQDIFYSINLYPQYLILIFAVIFFGLMFLISSIIKLISIFVRAKIFFSDSYTITIWSGTPIIVLLPFAIILNRVLVFSPGIIWLVMPLAVIISIWVFMRLFRSVSVVFDIRATKSYIIGFLLLAVSFGIILSIYEINLSVIPYSQYLFNVLLRT